MTDPIARHEPAMRSLLGDLLRIPSTSGHEGPLTRHVADVLGAAGLSVDLWQATEADVARHAVGRHLPLHGRPTLVATLPGTGGGGRSLLFNAHADTVGVPDPATWTRPPYGGVAVDGRFYGRGACDVKGPLVSAMWALLALRERPPAGDVSIELVPGEEDCVTLGTLTSVVRGHTADGCVVLEPTEGLPRNASRPGLRFEVTCHGRAVHGTVKWLGVDAIALARRVLDALTDLERTWNDRTADPLYVDYPIARPLTVDWIYGGPGQGMVCDACHIAGYLDLLPGDEPAAWAGRLSTGLKHRLDETTPGSIADHVTVTCPEVYPGHRTPAGSALCRAARAAVSDLAPFRWSGFNAGCEAGLRATLLSTPTLVWGPGSLAQAHAADEFVAFDDVRTVAARFATFARHWCGGG